MISLRDGHKETALLLGFGPGEAQTSGSAVALRGAAARVCAVYTDRRSPISSSRIAVSPSPLSLSLSSFHCRPPFPFRVAMGAAKLATWVVSATMRPRVPTDEPKNAHRKRGEQTRGLLDRSLLYKRSTVDVGLRLRANGGERGRERERERDENAKHRARFVLAFFFFSPVRRPETAAHVPLLRALCLRLGRRC